MPSWMTAFVSKHPNMHCSATRGKISLQHPISRGLLPPRRGADCARAEIVRVLVFACVCMCVSTGTHTHTYICLSVCVCLWIQTSSLHCLSDLSSNRQLSHLLSHTSNSRLLFPAPLHSLSLWCSSPIHPSSKYLPSLNLTLPSLLLPILLPHPSLPASIYPSLHLHLLPAG